MSFKLPALKPRRVDAADYSYLPPPNKYREFDVSPGAITAASGFRRDRRTLSAPESLFRMTGLAVRNLDATATLTVALPGRTATVPPSTTDILNGGNTKIDEYSITPSADVASGKVLLVERCRSWAGWNIHRQDV